MAHPDPQTPETPATSDTRQRCGWCGSDPLYQHYHDTEWGVPQRDPRMLWEMLMLEGFQAGLSWITVLRKREAFRAAFDGFDPRQVARYDEHKIAALMLDGGIIRARAKIEATIAGAKIYNAMADAGESFTDYCWAFTDGQVLRGDGVHFATATPLSERVSKDLKGRGFKFVGPTIVHAWMQAIGMVDDHALHCFRRAAAA
jgi:DNA-3-methyladenine glycosylase I